MKIRYNIQGLDCPNCAAKLENLLQGKPGIAACKINFITEKMTVESDLPQEERERTVQETVHAFSGKVKVEQA